MSLDRDASGRPIGFSTIIRDCTERAAAQLELAKAKEAAENATKAKSETKGEDAVPTAGAVSTYLLLAASNVNLAPHVGQRVRVSAVQVEKGHGDADVKVKDETKIEREDARDSKSTSKTKLELEKSPSNAYTVVAVTPLGMACSN